MISAIVMLGLTACGASTGTSSWVNAKDTEQVLSQSVESEEHTLQYQTDFTNGGYYYDHLSDKIQAIYQVLYNCVVANEQTAELYGIPDQNISLAFKTVLFDHPEIFYVEGFQLEHYSGPDEKIIFRPNYTKTVEEQAVINKELADYTQRLLASITGTTSFSKVQGVYDYIVEHTQYDITAPDLGNLSSVTSHGRAVCEGYAKATMYFCNLLGIDCIVVPGYIRSNGTAHLWNAVKLDGQWYFVDTTWGDEDFENSKRAPEVRYDYLCVSQEQIRGTHQVEEVVEIPQCISTEANYYYQTGRVIYQCSKADLGDMFKDLEINGVCTFACSDQLVYQQVSDYLISEKHVFDYLISKDLQIGYFTNSNVRSFTFWIKTGG